MRTRRFRRALVTALGTMLTTALGTALAEPMAMSPPDEPRPPTIESVQPSSVASGGVLTLLGESLPAVGGGLVLLHDEAGRGALCTIESSDGSLLTCRVGAVADGFVGRVTAVPGRWHELGTDVVEGELGTWLVEASFFLGDRCGSSDSWIGVGAGGASSAPAMPPWMQIDLPGDTTIGVDHVLQPGCGGGGGGQKPSIHTRGLRLRGDNASSSAADPEQLARDVAAALQPSYRPFGVTTTSQDSVVRLEVPQATAADFVLLTAALAPQSSTPGPRLAPAQ